VPLIFDGPSIDHGRVVADAVSLVDVAPTVAAGAGLERFESDGQNLAIANLRPLASAPRALYAESFAPLVEFGWSPLRELRRGDWKYISAPQPELYDLKNDPGETRNVIDDQPARALEFAREIERIAPLAASETTTDGAPRPDPKERREIAARMAEVVSGELRGPLLERALREIIRDDPGNGIANLRLAELLADSRRCKEAVKRLTLARAAQAPGAEGVILRTCSPQRP
jgi:hypothetical protein